MTEFPEVMGQLLAMFGEDVVHYEHQGDDFESSDKFWPEDGGHANSGTTYVAAIEESITDDTQEQMGRVDDADMAMWFDQNVCSEGDKIEYRGRNLIVTEVNNMWGGGEFARQLVGLKSDER